MNDSGDDYRDLLNQKRFLSEIELGIRDANRELIHTRIPELNKDKILDFAVAVGRLRARYHSGGEYECQRSRRITGQRLY